MAETGNLSQRRGGKSAEAFRTISEVADDLDVPQHVLRFWETKFAQVRPLKRGGGRRYYRPEDVELLRSIRALLYTDGYTIKGVQKLLREGGVKPGEGLADGAEDAREAAAGAGTEADPPSTESATPTPAGSTTAALTSEQRRALGEVLGELEALKKLLDSATE